jgi:beta-galactosidase
MQTTRKPPKGLLPVFLSIFGVSVALQTVGAESLRHEYLLENGWMFTRGDVNGAHLPSVDTSAWEQVRVPHDWAITGPFDQEIDKQVVRIEQNNETKATEKTGRTGALPFIGTGWYRYEMELPKLEEGRQAVLHFDGAMSEAQVYVNGTKVGHRPYGYAYFHFDVTEHLQPGNNLIAVRLENRPFSSRWYPGAGLYRKVRLELRNRVGFEQWGVFVTTPMVTDEVARVAIRAAVTDANLSLRTRILDGSGHVVAEKSGTEAIGAEIIQHLALPKPQRWSPDTPYLYTAVCELSQGGKLVDEQRIRFGVRTVEFVAGKGFLLNGEVTKFRGVCLHHDLGPLGAAVNVAALRRQLTILKDLGCNAVRSAHNMPSLEQLDLCDEMGFLFIAESFDEWAKPKVENGYNRFFNEWAERDVVTLVRATRNHPSIVLWSSGNEVPDQWGPEGVKRAKWLQDLFHREDPTRKVTVGMDQVKAVMESGFGALLDIPGLNYRVHLYEEAFERFPQGLILGSETASTVSSRGVYKFPVEVASMRTYEDGQSSSYDLEHCSWSNIPEVDFVMQDDKDWVIGEFVWTGFDYLGEPTPYDEYWPARSSYFGILDLAGLPKDRYYLYRSRWNPDVETLHILPHWNWPERVGKTTPVFVYTNYDRAELFLNGVSQGIRQKRRDGTLQERYRLMWMDVVYQPGTLRVVALDADGKPIAAREKHTAGAPAGLRLEADRTRLIADGKDLSFVTVSLVDAAGNLCPCSDQQLEFTVSGAGRFKAVCNGDATSLEPFHLPKMRTFSGQLVVIVESSGEPGEIVLEASGKGLPRQHVLLHAAFNN